MDDIDDDDIDDDDMWDDVDDYCPECGDGENLRSACIDDLCHGGEVPCMHGDWSAMRCSLCGK